MAKITITLEDLPSGEIHSEWTMDDTEQGAGKSTAAKRLANITVEFLKGVFRSHLAVEQVDLGREDLGLNTTAYGDMKYGEGNGN